MTPVLTLALQLLAEGPVALEWRAPPTCPDGQVLLRELGALTEAGELADGPRVRVRVTATARQVGDRHQLDLQIRTPSMSLRRRLEADACATLVQAAALLIAIAIDPLEVASQVSAASATPQLRLPADELPLAVTAPEPPPAPSPPRSTAPVRPRPTPRLRVAGLVRLEGALDAGATPGVAGDVAGAVGLLRGRLRLELHGLYTAPRAIDRGPAAVATLARWAVGARGCGRVVQGRLEIPLCLGVEAGQWLAAGAGITVGRQQARPPWLGLLAGPGLVWSPHPRVGLGARAELVVAPLRARFTVGEELVYTVDPAGLRVSAGVELRFGPGGRSFAARDRSGAVRPLPRGAP